MSRIISRRGVLFGLVTAPLLARTPSEEAGRALERELESAVHARTSAWCSGDLETHARYTADCFSWNGIPERQIKRTEVLDTPAFDIDRFEVVSVYSNVAVLRYVYTEYLSQEEGSPFDRQRVQEVWIHDAGGWKTMAAESFEVVGRCGKA